MKCKLKAYHERKATLASSWLNAREQLISALSTRQALPWGRRVSFLFAKKRCVADLNSDLQGNSYAQIISI